MPTQQNSRYAATCSCLANTITDYESRIRVSKNNAKLKTDYEEQINRFTSASNVCDVIINICKPTLQDIQTYINTKRAESMQNINNALRLAEEIIPDSEPGVHFELDGEKAILLTEDGLTVEGTEGDGFCQVSSVFVRAAVAKSNPAILDTLIFDEVFSLISPENSATLSLYLNTITQDTQVISIEQKPQVYSNIDCVMYTFNKTDKFAEVTRKEIRRGETDGTALTS